MNKRFFSGIVLFFVCITIFCAEPGAVISLTAPKTNLLVGEPIVLVCTVSNASNAPLMLAAEKTIEGTDFPTGMKLKIADITNQTDATYLCRDYEGGDGLIVRGNGWPRVITIQPGQSVSTSTHGILSACPLNMVPPHVFEFTATLTSNDPDYPKGIWKGAISSAPVRVTLAEPQGDDKAYIEDLFAYLKSDKIWRGTLDKTPLKTHEVTDICAASVIEAHPASIYTAWAVYKHDIGSPLFRDVNLTLKQMETGIYAKNNLPSKEGLNGTAPATAEQCIRWRQKWIETILKYHPDFVMAGDFPLTRALDQIALKNYQAGAADLEQLCSNAKPDVAKKARQYLGLIKQKGWIKE
jgi:hypothetical protein